jgi:hypothetical protein
MMMKEFFKSELKLVHVKTGIRQLETLMNKGDKWTEEAEQIIDFMVFETNRPPFDMVGVDVKQRVIQAAIIDDKDFIGLNAKFVKRALNAWWAMNKDRYYDSMVKHADESIIGKSVEVEDGEYELPGTSKIVKVENKIIVSERYPNVSKQEADAMIKEFEKTLSGGLRSVPELTDKEIKKEGQEREDMLKAQLDKLSTKRSYQPTPDDKLIMQDKLREIASGIYKDYIKFDGLRHYEIEGYTIFCESQAKAQEIYMEAVATLKS